MPSPQFVIPKYSRKRFYSIFTLGNTETLDFLSFQWTRFSDFLQNYPVVYHRVQEVDIGRLDNIAYQYYEQTEAWWIIMLANNMSDIFNDMYVGQLLIIPSISQIESFYQAIQASRRGGQNVPIPRRTV